MDAFHTRRTPTNRSKKISSYEQIFANGDKEKAYLLQNMTESYDFLTSKILKHQQEQELAAIHFLALYDYLLFIPSILVTLMSGILAFLVKSPLVVSDKSQSMIALTIAILSTLSTFGQSLTKQLNYGGRSGFHQSAATTLRKLYDTSILKCRELRLKSVAKALVTGKRPTLGINLAQIISNAENEDSAHDEEDRNNEIGGEGVNNNRNYGSLNNNNSGSPAADKDDSEDSMNLSKIISQVHQAVDGVNSTIPIRITAAFNMLESRIKLVNNSLMKDKHSTKISWGKLYPIVYYQLTQTIIQSAGWPIFIPDPEWSVNKTLRDFKYTLRTNENNDADLLHDLAKRAELITSVGNRMVKYKEEQDQDHQRREINYAPDSFYYKDYTNASNKTLDKDVHLETVDEELTVTLT